MPLLTVVIPAHNPRPGILARTLDALRAQTLPASQMQVVLVDNRSEPPLSAAEWSARLPGIELVREDTLGLIHARLAGIAAAKAEVLAFVDDDNLLAPDYLERALAFLTAHPEVAVLGGRILPEFAVPPPAWLQSHFHLLALRDLGDLPLISAHSAPHPPSYDYFAPVGAGMVMRTSAARSYVAWHRISSDRMTGRVGSALGGCDDCELVLRALLDGHQCAYSPELKLTHVIPAARLEFQYLARLALEGQKSWGEFSARHGFAAPVSRTGASLRLLKDVFRLHAWTRSGRLSWLARRGYLSGLRRAQSAPSP